MRWLAILIVMCGASSAWAADTGPVSLTVAANGWSAGSQSWAIPGTGGLASSSGYASQESLWCLLSGGDFSAIPVGATIDGVSFAVTVQSNDGMETDATVAYLVKAGTVSGTGLAGTMGPWPMSASVAAWGGATDLGGTTLTRDDVIASGFGVGVRAAFGGMYSQATVVSATCTVYYTAASSSVDVEWWERSDCLLCWLVAMFLGVHLYGVSCRFRSNRVGRGI